MKCKFLIIICAFLFFRTVLHNLPGLCQKENSILVWAIAARQPVNVGTQHPLIPRVQLPARTIPGLQIHCRKDHH